MSKSFPSEFVLRPVTQQGSIMTVEVLLHSPTQNDFQRQLGSLLVQGSGRIFLVTGNFSRNGVGAASDFLRILEWAASAPSRKLDVLVGVFEYQGILQTSKVINDLVSQILLAKEQFKKIHPHARMNIPVSFYGAKKWHAKAIGLTGLGVEFTKAEKIIFGSTNFSESAMYGHNFEIDVYADVSTDAGQIVLHEYVYKLRALISEAIKSQSIPDFHDQLLAALGGAVEITPTGIGFV